MNAPATSVSAQIAVLPPSQDGRRTRRRAVNVAALIEDAGAAFSGVVVTDLSETGCRASVSTPMEPGTAFILKLPGMEILRAEVIWSEGIEIGCQFADEVHPGTINQILGRGAEIKRPAVLRKDKFGTRGLG
jgi:hypothetical protein